MKRLLYIFFLLASCTAPTSIDENTKSYDVCVYGGTSAGVIAAYSAKKLGKSVILIEPGNRLGGLSSGGLGKTDIGNKYAVTGLSRDFYRRLGKIYGTFEQWLFEPKAALRVFNDYVEEAGLEVWYSKRLIKAEVEGAKIKSILLEDSKDPAGEKMIVEAKMFIDCTYEGDLMAQSGVSYTVGREANKTYGETINGVQLRYKHQFPDGVDPYKTPGDPSSGLLWGISDGELAENGTGDNKVQAYNFRICLTNVPENSLPITRPENYDSSRYELLVRLFEAQPEKRKINQYFIWSLMPNGKTDINNRGGFSTDMIGENYRYPEADYEEREQIIKNHEDYTKGLLYFYVSDPRVPKELQDFVRQWGYPKDEYQENGHWSPQLYVREARRMIGAYVMTEHHCVGDEVVSDPIGLAAYTMDSHNCQRIVTNGMVKNEGNVEVGGFGPYPISYRSLVPKKAECQNLLVPVCLSASHIAFGSIRMEPVFMVLAQVSGLAASMAIDENMVVQEVDASLIQKKMQEDPLLNGSVPEIIVDDMDTSGLEISGEWERREIFGSPINATVLINDNPAIKKSKIRFVPTIAQAGRYKVLYYCPRVKTDELPSEINVRVAVDGKVEEENIDYKEHLNNWAEIGEYLLNPGTESYVEVAADDASSPVVADAVMFFPMF